MGKRNSTYSLQRILDFNPSDGKYTIYMIYCKDENVKDTYIGSTQFYEGRIKRHIMDANRDKPLLLYKIIKRNGGIKNWDFKKLNELEFWRTDNIRKQEQVYIETYKPTMNSVRAYRKI